MARYDKIHLFDVSLPDANETYLESETIYSGDQLTVVDTPFAKIGIIICYDLRFPEQIRKLSEMGAEVVLIPAAFTMRTGKSHFHS